MSTIPAIDQALLPAEIRKGSKQEREAYSAALGFERQLVEQLTKQLNSSISSGGDDEQGSAATNAYKDQFPGAMADAVMGAGGLGLAAQITQSILSTTSRKASA